MRPAIRYFLAALGIATLVGPALAGSGSDEQLVELGRKLFFDRTLSVDAKVSCASCHRPDRLFADGRARAIGANGRVGTRNAPSLLDVARQRSLFWDGRRPTLESQALDPLTNPVEHGLRGERNVLRQLRASAPYRQAFRAAFGVEPAELTLGHVQASLAAYQRTLTTGVAPIDRFLAGDPAALSQRALNGWLVFSGLADCVRCHTADRTNDGRLPPLFTDHSFHSIGVGQARIARKLPRLVTSVNLSRRVATGIDHRLLADPDVAELGRFVVTLDVVDLGRFKTPGLRNVALTAPYMHDGSVPTLEAAVDREVYYRGHRDGRPLVLTPQERDDLVHFLVEGLTALANQTDGAQAASDSRINIK